MKAKKDLKRQLIDLLSFVPLILLFLLSPLITKSDPSGLSAAGIFLWFLLFTPLIALAGTMQTDTKSALRVYVLLDGLLIIILLIMVIT